MSLALAACLIAVATALACAIPGVFVVLRRESMVIDGVGHAVLPGIAAGYLLTPQLDSPLLLVTAAISGLIVALGSRWLNHTRLLPHDTGLGLIFPALFSLGVILISTYLKNSPLDVQTVLVGDVNLTAMTNPSYVWVLLALAAINLAFILVCLPRLTSTAFDPTYAQAAGVRAGVENTIFTVMVTVTASFAFRSAGTMLVLALMIMPVVCARLMCTRVIPLMVVACIIAISGAAIGFWIAYAANLATSPTIALTYTVVLLVALCVRRNAASAAHSPGMP